MPEAYSFTKSEDDALGIYYTFSSERYSYTVYFNDKIYSDLVQGYDYLTVSYSFGFFQKTIDKSKKKGQDERVKITVIQIVRDFLDAAHDEAIVLFHCDISDDRQYTRHITFKKWYDKSDIQDTIKMSTVEVAIGDISNFVGHIVHAKNPHILKLNDEFESLASKIIQEHK